MQMVENLAALPQQLLPSIFIIYNFGGSANKCKGKALTFGLAALNLSSNNDLEPVITPSISPSHAAFSLKYIRYSLNIHK